MKTTGTYYLGGSKLVVLPYHIGCKIRRELLKYHKEDKRRICFRGNITSHNNPINLSIEDLIVFKETGYKALKLENSEINLLFKPFIFLGKEIEVVN